MQPPDQNSECQYVPAERFGSDRPRGDEASLPELGAQDADGGLSLLLCRPPETFEADQKALFLGPKAENAELVERMLADVFRDHAFWRRNFRPGDPPVIEPLDQDERSFRRFWAHFQRELQILLGELKSDVPFFSPRYIGHMKSDTCLPAMIAYIAAMLYDPNNVSWEAAPVTTLLEIQVGRDLAKMVGFGSTAEELEGTWGHITSGGTVANFESIWVAKAVKFLPIAVRFAAEDLGLEGLTAYTGEKLMTEMTTWELSNLSPAQALDLKDRFLEEYVRANSDLGPQEATRKAIHALKAHEILSLGDHAFFSRLTGQDSLNTPLIVVPETMHYSWVKGAGAMGVGSGQLATVPIDKNFRMDAQALKHVLERALLERRPVIEVVAVVGSTEVGAVDPIHRIVELRDEMAAQGLGFSLHCDAAYGGYIEATLRSADGQFRSLADVQTEYDGWPTEEVYRSFKALGQLDSITIDPHKLGYAPYPAGAVVFRDGRSKELVAQEASYALGGRTQKDRGEVHIGKYILEGSKPGAAAAAVYLSHRVVPLDERGYGKIIGHTIRATRNFHRRLLAFAEIIKDFVRIHPLVFPDTNIINYLANPVGNDRLDLMNTFSHNLYRQLSIDPHSPVQTRSFIVSHTELSYAHHNPEVIRAILSEQLGIKRDFFVSRDEASRRTRAGLEGYDHEVVVFRATLMNPFVLDKVAGSKDYLDLFFDKLASLLRTITAHSHSVT